MSVLQYANFTVAGQSYLIAGTKNGVAFVGSPNGGLAELKKWYPLVDLEANQANLQTEITELTAYLHGQRQRFDLPLDLKSGTKFQRQVWRQLQLTDYGQQVTYSQLAIAIKRPNAIRAVATAVAKNPVLLIIPCHRVVRKDGSIGQYRGGQKMKRDLLQMESQLSRN